MDEDKKVSYDKDYIEQLYLRYMATGKSQEGHKAELQEKIKGKLYPRRGLTKCNKVSYNEENTENHRRNV